MSTVEQLNQASEHQQFDLIHTQTPDVIPDWVMEDALSAMSQDAPGAVAIPETVEDQYTRERAAKFIGACLTGHEAELSVGEKPDRKSTRLNSSHSDRSRMPSSA